MNDEDLVDIKPGLSATVNSEKTGNYEHGGNTGGFLLEMYKASYVQPQSIDTMRGFYGRVASIPTSTDTSPQQKTKAENVEGDYNAYLYIIITISLAISVCAVIVYIKWHAISYYVKLVKISKGRILFKLNRKTTKHFQYDVFISYSENDRAWVLEQLLPQLEQNGTSICLHERDFQVGMSILENIMESMNRSRCLLLVISKSFIKSRWCQFEMNLAQFLLVEMRDRHIILAFLEHIEKNDRPKLLHYLMSTKTYIEWPQENGNKFNEEKNRFYRRLNTALQHNFNKELT